MLKLNTNIKVDFFTDYGAEPVINAKINGSSPPYSCSWEVTSSGGNIPQHKILTSLKDIIPKYGNSQTSSVVLADNEDAFRTDRYETYETRETVLKLTVTDPYKQYNTFIYTASVDGYSTITPNKYIGDGAKYCGNCYMQRAIVNNSLFDFLDDPQKQPPYKEVLDRYTEDYPYIPTQDNLDSLNGIISDNPYGIDLTNIDTIDVDNFYSTVPDLRRRIQDVLFKNNYEEVYNQEYPIYTAHQKILEGKTFTSYKDYIDAIKTTLLDINKFDSFGRANFKDWVVLLGPELHEYDNLTGNIASIKTTIGDAKIKFLQSLPMPSEGQLPVSGKAGQVILFYGTSPTYGIEEKWAWNPVSGEWDQTLGGFIYELFEAREVIRLAWMANFNYLNLVSRAFSQAAFSAALHRLR